MTFLLCSHLPLRLLPVQESLKNRNILLQTRQPNLQLRSHFLRISTQLRIKVFSVWSRRHGGAEDGFNHEGVVWLEGGAVGVTE